MTGYCDVTSGAVCVINVGGCCGGAMHVEVLSGRTGFCRGKVPLGKTVTGFNSQPGQQYFLQNAFVCLSKKVQNSWRCQNWSRLSNRLETLSPFSYKSVTVK